jgi:Domain of unknown function (DUF4288)
MSRESWFSATLQFYFVNSVVGKTRAEDSVFLVRATEFNEAFKKFLSIGKENETSFQNRLGQEIKKRFAAITTLDIIPQTDLDGVEIKSTPLDEPDTSLTISSPLDPSKSEPTQTI